jgi:hypothetical protein
VLAVVLIIRISRFVMNSCLLFIMYNNRENIYCEHRGSIFNFLNNSLHKSLFLEFVIIVIIFF